MHVNARPVVRKHADVRDGIGFWVTHVLPVSGRADLRDLGEKCVELGVNFREPAEDEGDDGPEFAEAARDGALSASRGEVVLCVSGLSLARVLGVDRGCGCGRATAGLARQSAGAKQQHSNTTQRQGSPQDHY